MKYSLINVYRIFNPTDGRTQRQFFEDQLTRIKTAVENCDRRSPIVLGDFNLDEGMKYRNNYSNKQTQLPEWQN